LREFFDLLGETRSAQLTHVSADGAEWIHDVGAQRAPQALLKNPDALSGGQKTTLAVIAKINSPLYRAYLLEEQLQEIFQAKGTYGKALLADWLSWVRRCRILEFVKLAKTITRFLSLIHNTLDYGLSNALSEATNTHIRLLTCHAHGYHSPDALIAMATLTRGGLRPPLPGRS
jgi:transposase